MGIGNRIRETVSAIPSAFNFSVSGPATPRYAKWSAVYSDGEKLEYWAESSDEDKWEHGLGSMVGTTAISRDVILETYVAGVYNRISPNAVDFNTANVQVYQSPSLNKDTFLSRENIVHSATINTPLNGRSYTCLVVDGVTTTTWNAPIPAYGVAGENEFMCHVDFTAPATGSGTVNIPAGWQQMGTLGAITLAAGDDPISCTLRSRSDGTVQLYRAETAV